MKLFFSRNRFPHKHLAGKSPTNLDYNYITDGIYVGTNQCCAVGLSEVLKKEGIKVDISLEENKIDQPFGVEFYVWIPTLNYFPPDPDQMSFGVSSLEKIVSQKKKVYIHCKNGHGRSSTLLSAYLIKNKGMTWEEAMEFIKSKRPGAHIEEAQIKAVNAFAKSLKR